MSVINDNDIFLQIKSALSEQFDIDSTQLTLDSRLSELGVDSLHMVGIMLDIETELGIKLGDISMPPNPSLGELVAAIQKNILVPQA